MRWRLLHVQRILLLPHIVLLLLPCHALNLPRARLPQIVRRLLLPYEMYEDL